MNHDIRNAIRGYLLSTVLEGENPAYLTDELDLCEAGILDSVTMLKLIDFLEHRFHITIAVDGGVAEAFTNIDRLTRYVADRAHDAAAATSELGHP